ncbi:hypothetical protein P9112_007845 [Eukaryota sp. TZLM1-RC]
MSADLLPSASDSISPDISLHQIWAYAPNYKKRLLGGIVLGLLAGSGFPLFAQVMGDFFDVFLLPSDEIKSELLSKAILMCAIGVFWFITLYSSTCLFANISHKAIHELRHKFFSSMMNQPLAFFDENSPVELVAQMAEQGNTMLEGLVDKIPMVLSFGVQFVFGMAVAFYNSWQVTLGLLAITPLMIISSIIEYKLMYSASKKESGIKKETNALSQQSFSAIRTIKAFSGESLIIRKFSEFAKKPFKAGVKRSRVESRMMSSMYALMFLTYAVALYISGIYVARGVVGPGEVLSAFFSVMFAIMGISLSSAQLPDIVKAKGAAQSFMERVNQEGDYLNESGIIKELKGHLKIENVTFRYPTRQDVTVLKNFSLEIEPNTTVAFVGTSGGGKSTIINLLQKFYDPEEGNVIVDGIPLTDLNLTAFRRQVALVEQHPKLFSGTIKENILFGLFGTGLEYSQPELENKVIDAAKKPML